MNSSPEDILNGRGTTEIFRPDTRDDAPPRPLVQLFDPTTLAGRPVPPRQWLVGDWIPIGGTTLLGGDGGTGKSLLAQQLMTCCATGRQWLGLPTLRARAIYWPCEDDQDELHRRQADINKALEVGFSDLADMRWEARCGLDNILMVFDGNGGAELTELFLEMERQAISFAARLAIIDTAADVFGGNENIRPEVRRFIADCLNRMARVINGSVLLCIHPSRAGLASGEGDGASTAWHNTARARLYLTRPDQDGDTTPDESARVLRRRKANFAARDEIRMHWRDGVFVNDQPPALASNTEGIAQTVFLEALAKLTKRHIAVSASPCANNFAPKMMIKNGLARRIRQRDLVAAMNSLFEAGRIESQSSGPPSRQSFRIAEAAR